MILNTTSFDFVLPAPWAVGTDIGRLHASVAQHNHDAPEDDTVITSAVSSGRTGDAAVVRAIMHFA